jgi:two-component system sensor histidine kinase AlgZ
LLENAVYHGVEPSAAGGMVRVEIGQQGEVLRIRVSNPCAAAGAAAGGHQMALNNIRERLSLYFDLEASLRVDSDAARYQVTLSLPCALSRR